MDNSLAPLDPTIQHLERANTELVEAKKHQDVRRAKKVHDIANLTEQYARDQQLGEEIINRGHAIKITALAVIGEIIQQLKKDDRLDGGGRPPNKPVVVTTGFLEERSTLAELGVSKHVSAIAQKLADLPTEMFEQVRDGTLSMSRAVAAVSRAKKKEDLSKAIENPSAKYRVIYADPPWAYNDECSDGSVQAHGASRKYPTMNLTELCTLPVASWCETDAVLFLWITSPLLPVAWPLIESWGFEYKASFIWDKIKHNMGHYNSVRHEFLLVCTRGSCTPDVVQLFDSVQSIERTDHSVKPEAFREIIDTIYPLGKRLEMFARRDLPTTWDAWGNEA